MKRYAVELFRKSQHHLATNKSNGRLLTSHNHALKWCKPLPPAIHVVTKRGSFLIQAKDHNGGHARPS